VEGRHHRDGLALKGEEKGTWIRRSVGRGGGGLILGDIEFDEIYTTQTLTIVELFNGTF
jgi:hypothetical protein